MQPNLHGCGLQWKNFAQYRHSVSASTSLPFHHPSSSSDPEETFNLLDGEISGFTSLLSIFTKGLLGLIVPQERGPVLLFSFCCVPCFSQRDLRQIHFLPVSVKCIRFFFWSPTVYGVYGLRETRSRRSSITCTLFLYWRQWTQTCSLDSSTCGSSLCGWSGWCWLPWEEWENQKVPLWNDWTAHSWFLCTFFKISQYVVPHNKGQQRTPY